jgi:hypothetical protein
MTITKNPQIKSESNQNKEKPEKTEERWGDVRQDNGGFDRRALALC